MFARSYFEKSTGFTPRITLPPHPETSLIVVIPTFQEPDLPATLNSLIRCQPPAGKTEVILLINEPESCDSRISSANRKTLQDILAWLPYNKVDHLTFHPVGPVKLPDKWAGVGLARKAGMDEALYRFRRIGKPGGIILSLDADTLVEENYLQAVEEHFLNHPTHIGATLCFRHITEGLPERQILGIRLYEQYLYYYKNACAWAGFPHALYTIGSAFAVTADGYMRRGGMTRRKAGEDFYFLQTLTQAGSIGEILSSCVHPSARVSQRVPFGTGPAMKKWMEGGDDLMYTFDFQAFRELKLLFSQREKFYQASPDTLTCLSDTLPASVSRFIKKENLDQRFRELSGNCSSPEIFNKRFFQVFNAFKILRFLHFVTPVPYPKIPVGKALTLLQKSLP